jgi:hypothetical protein
MNAFVNVLLRGSFVLLPLIALQPAVVASVDDAQSFALQAAEPYVKQGFQVREDYWGGDLGSGEKKAVRQQLFKGNEYWFWLGTEVDRAKVSVHVYDSDGKLAEEPDGWEKGHFAAAHIIPKTTGSLSNRQRNGRTGRWYMVSGENDSTLPNEEGRLFKSLRRLERRRSLSYDRNAHPRV